MSLAVVRSAVHLLLDRMQRSVGDHVEVEGDFYWTLDPATMMDPYTEPESPTLGSLADCLEHLRRILDDPGSVITRDLVWLGDVLRALGMAISPGDLYPEE